MASSPPGEPRRLTPDDRAAVERLMDSCEARDLSPWSAADDVAGFGVDGLGDDDGESSAGPAGLDAALLVRSWGRTAHVTHLAVRPARRGRGLARALLQAAARDVHGSHVAVFGCEVAPDAAGLLCLLAEVGFKPGSPTLHLERTLAVGSAGPRLDEGVPEESAAAASPEPDEGVTSGEAAATGPRAVDLVLPVGVRLFDDRSTDDQESVRLVASSVDADLDPSAWIDARLRVGADLLIARTGADADENRPVALALAEREGDVLRCRLLMATAGSLEEGVGALVDALAAVAAHRGLTAVSVPGATQSWDACRRLLADGYRPVGHGLRMTLGGYPERTDPSAVSLATWR